MWALTTDGTNLFAGGTSAVNGTSVQPLVKLHPITGAVLPFNTGAIPDIVYALDYAGGNVYAGGDFSLRASLRKGAPGSTTRPAPSTRPGTPTRTRGSSR